MTKFTGYQLIIRAKFAITTSMLDAADDPSANIAKVLYNMDHVHEVLRGHRLSRMGMAAALKTLDHAFYHFCKLGYGVVEDERERSLIKVKSR